MVIGRIARTRRLSAESTTALTVAAVLLNSWLVLGMYVDAWAHHHLSFETFFTPWHALLYSGAAANFLFLGWWWAMRGRSLPSGYGLSLVGGVLFGLGGVADLVWHAVFGIERDFAAILSPTHLVLMLSAGLIVSGPLRAAWRSTSVSLPYSAVWSLALVDAVLAFFMQDLNPLTAQWANRGWAVDHSGLIKALAELRITEMLGVDNMVLATAVLVGSLLLVLMRFEIRPGQVFLLVTLPMVGVVLTYAPDPIILVPVLAGAFGEASRLLLRPSVTRTIQLRLYVVLLTLVLWGLYMVGLAATDGVFWPIHSEFGVVAVSMLGTWLLTYLAFPPAGFRTVAARA